MSQNGVSFPLNALPQADRTKPIPGSFREETTRVANEAERLKNQVRTSESLKDVREENVKEFSRIQSEYASFKEKDSTVREIERVKNSLKPFRPPTAPSSDLEKERKEISEIAKRNLFFVQAALFLVVLAMLSYVMFSLNTANLIAFALLCVGIAMGFFLRR
jgi:cation transport ATPase